jgi:hypothetical protein
MTSRNRVTESGAKHATETISTPPCDKFALMDQDPLVKHTFHKSVRHEQTAAIFSTRTITYIDVYLRGLTETQNYIFT